jgi:putative ABC transport system permease protein
MTPPRFASALLRLCAHRRDRTFVEQDLADEFARIAAGRGARAARAWYRRQVAGSVLPLVAERLRLSWPALPRGAPLGRDVIQAFRSLTRNAGLSTTILATLVVGLTTTLAAALLLYGVVLRPLPYGEPDQLVAVRPSGPRLPAAVRSISLPDLDDWQQTPRSFAALSGYSDLTFTLTGLGDPRRVDGLRVGPRFGEVVRTRPILGRPFEPRDFVQGSQYVTLLGHALWQRDLGGDPGAVGRSLTLDGRRYEIVGVLPDLPFRDITEQHEFWVPLVARPGVTWEPVRGNGFVSVLARLAPGTTLRAAQEELSSVAATLAERYPQSNADKPAVLLEPLHDAIVKAVRRPLLLVFAAVGSVLLVACGNLVNLLLAHAERRRHEFAVRLALGAGSGRIRRQVLLEVAAIVTVAMAVSLIMAPALARLFTTLYPTPLPSSDALGITTRALGGALALGVVVTVLLAWPQMRRASPSITAGGTVRVTGSRNDRLGRAALIAVQVAFTLVLAFAGVALLRSMARLAAIEPGIDAAGVVAFSVSPS